jgi:tetratricopeptide (TPR) repeat protein
MLAVPNQTVRGDAAIAVQIDGPQNNVTINSKGSRPVLDRPHKRRGRGAPTNERQLLLTEWRATTLVGRERELELLREWREEDIPQSVRCLTGRAGSGKSRLAIEACEEAEHAGWDAGFLGADQLRLAWEEKSLNQWRPAADTLIVIDDAAVVAPMLKDWFATLARSSPGDGEPRLRILLLERYADPDAEVGWWADLKRPRSLAQADAGDLIGPGKPHSLPPIARAEERRALLSEAMFLAANILRRKPLKPPPVGENPDFDRRLADDRLENEPLFLLMAGMVAVERGAAAALSIGRIELAAEIASLERLRLTRLAESRGFAAGGALLLHLAGCITLQRGCKIADAIALIAEELAATSLTCEMAPEMLVDVLAEALPQAGGEAIDRVRPDLIGEAFFFRQIQGPRGRAEAERIGTVKRAWRREQERVVKSLVLASQDLAAGEDRHPVVRWLAEISRTSEDILELMKIANGLPFETVALREVGALVEGRIVELALQNPDEDQELCALSLSKLAVRLGALGKTQEALASAEKATALYRALGPADPNGNGLATVLSNLAQFHCMAGQWKQGAEAAEEAVTLNRARKEEGTAERAKLATSLNSLARAYRGLGRLPDALKAASEARDLRRLLAAEDPETFNSSLAKSLISVAILLGNTGEMEQALIAAEQSVDLYRMLAASQPDAFHPDFALALHTVANLLQNLGRNEEALDAAVEALKLRRTLAAKRPDAFNSALAVSLGGVASLLRANEQNEAALQHVDEAIRLLRELAAATPLAFDEFLAISLAVRSHILNDGGDLIGAASFAREAVLTLRRIFERFPEAQAIRMVAFIGTYVEYAEAAGVAIDVEVIPEVFLLDG